MFYQIKVVAQGEAGSADAALGTCWVKTSKGEAAAISAAIEKFWDPRLTAGDASAVATVLQEWDEDDEEFRSGADLEISDADYRDAARELKEHEGELEIDDEAVVSQGGDPGAYVQAWVWIPTREALDVVALHLDEKKVLRYAPRG